MGSFSQSTCSHSRPLCSVVQNKVGRRDEVIEDVFTGRKVDDGDTSQFLAFLCYNLKSVSDE